MIIYCLVTNAKLYISNSKNSTDTGRMMVYGMVPPNEKSNQPEQHIFFFIFSFSFYIKMYLDSNIEGLE